MVLSGLDRWQYVPGMGVVWEKQETEKMRPRPSQTQLVVVDVWEWEVGEWLPEYRGTLTFSDLKNPRITLFRSRSL